MPLAPIIISGRIRRPHAGRGLRAGFWKKSRNSLGRIGKNTTWTNAKKEAREECTWRIQVTHFGRDRIGQRASVWEIPQWQARKLMPKASGKGWEVSTGQGSGKRNGKETSLIWETLDPREVQMNMDRHYSPASLLTPRPCKFREPQK